VIAGTQLNRLAIFTRAGADLRAVKILEHGERPAAQPSGAARSAGRDPHAFHV